MFVTANQFYVFIACLSFGSIVGVIFSFVELIKYLVKKTVVIKVLIDFFAFVIVLGLYIIYSFNMHFPSFRLYMVLGVFLGIFAYKKSFHIILAKFLKKIYNIIKPKIKKLKVKRHDRRKSKKNDSGNDSGGSASARDIARNHGVSNNFN